jgi:hypothetical protein
MIQREGTAGGGRVDRDPHRWRGQGRNEMESVIAKNDAARISVPAARLAIAAATATVLLLASLRVLSPEFDPSWRMVSEYANGRYGWVLALMFVAWGVSSWALAFALRAEARTRPVRIGLVLLTLAGVGEAMAAPFGINDDALHSLAGALGILGLPIAAVLISVPLGRTAPWSAAKRTLLGAANLTWVSVALLAATFVLLIATFSRVAGGLPAHAPPALPPGVIGLVGWANRLLVVVYCVWVIAVARQAIKVRDRRSGLPRPVQGYRVTPTAQSNGCAARADGIERGGT